LLLPPELEVYLPTLGQCGENAIDEVIDAATLVLSEEKRGGILLL
jgi:hypothetical protein